MACGKEREATAAIHLEKNCNLVPGFTVEEVPLGKTAALVPEIEGKDLPLGRTLS